MAIYAAFADPADAPSVPAEAWTEHERLGVPVYTCILVEGSAAAASALAAHPARAALEDWLHPETYYLIPCERFPDVAALGEVVVARHSIVLESTDEGVPLRWGDFVICRAATWGDAQEAALQAVLADVQATKPQLVQDLVDAFAQQGGAVLPDVARGYKTWAPCVTAVTGLGPNPQQ